MAAKRRKKIRKDLGIQIRVTAEQKETLVTAATKAGTGLSTWMLITCLKAAQDAAKEAAK
jgi:uncharacterized protein (DUF1778 family)